MKVRGGRRDPCCDWELSERAEVEGGRLQASARAKEDREGGRK